MSDNRKPSYEPTPEEIRIQCAIIREGWSEETAQKRALGVTHRLEVEELTDVIIPVVDFCG